MSLADPLVFLTENSDGSAEMTISVDDDDHRFSVSQSGDSAIVSYEETLSWRGDIRTSEPRGEVWKMLMQSDEMTTYLDNHDLSGVRRNS